MKHLVLAFSLFIFIFFGCKKKNSCAVNNNSETISYKGANREYLIHIPSTYTGDNEVPLLLNFHGFGQSAEAFMATNDFRSLSESENFIVVYPQGDCLGGFSHWNAALNSASNKSDIDDLGFIDALITKLQSKYNIDEKRIYASGYSNGGFFTYALACYSSSKIAAVSAVSGTMLDASATCTPLHPTAIISFHGTSDDVVPYYGSEDYISVQTVLEYWNEYNLTNSSPVINTQGSIEYLRYTDGIEDVSVEHFKVNGGGHDLFEISFDSKNIETLIWDFLSKHDIDGLR